MIKFTVYCKPEPQGSTRAFIPKGWTRPVITSANPKMKSFRQEVSKTALAVKREMGFAYVFFEKHAPVRLEVCFYFQKPPSAPKKRTKPVVKPDLSKLVRSTEDALTGIIYEDDAQIVEIVARKDYGTPERVEILVSAYQPEREELGSVQEKTTETAGAQTAARRRTEVPAGHGRPRNC